ncbi:MAG TPA: hypothetical protein VM433_09830 [Mycobacteriales bacterium]|nr:hypothetical protein [Mycobacteriales bacterium]
MSGPQRARARRAALGGLLALTVGLSVVVTAPGAAAADPVLQPGQTASSGNIHLLKNLPKTGAFATEAAFNSDLAFKGHYALAGNYEGFTVYDIKNPRKTRQVVQVHCPGSQNDITVHKNLLFLSVDSRRSDDSCNSRALTLAADRAALESGNYWEGIRIFDISNPAAPRYVKSVETKCGSHTHTLVPTANGRDVFVYVSSYDTNDAYAKCRGDHDIISIVKVPVSAPTTAAVVAEPRLFNPGNEGGTSPTTGYPYSNTRGCHDITAYPEKGIAAGACMGEGVIMDIRNPAAPKVTATALDRENFAFWHSATFNNAASTVMFTDELGGGGGPTCGPPNSRYPHLDATKGANAYYTIGKGGTSLARQGYFKIPREQSETENCVAHNGSLIPAKGKDVMVQAWYQGGISVVDFTNPKKPVELGWWDRGPLSNERLILGGSWSAYYYDGFIYSNDIQQGLDVFEMRDPRVANGKSGKFPTDYNPQTQPSLDNKKA